MQAGTHELLYTHSGLGDPCGGYVQKAIGPAELGDAGRGGRIRGWTESLVTAVRRGVPGRGRGAVPGGGAGDIPPSPGWQAQASDAPCGPRGSVRCTVGGSIRSKTRRGHTGRSVCASFPEARGRVTLEEGGLVLVEMCHRGQKGPVHRGVWPELRKGPDFGALRPPKSVGGSAEGGRSRSTS